jgi:hypothetical protein
MDARTRRFLTALDEYINNDGEPRTDLPEPLLESLVDLKEMVEAPRYSQESPGEREAREVAEEHMPEEVVNELYSEDDESSDENIGVLN